MDDSAVVKNKFEGLLLEGLLLEGLLLSLRVCGGLLDLIVWFPKDVGQGMQFEDCGEAKEITNDVQGPFQCLFNPMEVLWD